jgi:trehalose synthase
VTSTSRPLPREKRHNPRISETPPLPPPPPKLDDYEAIIGRPQLDELHLLAGPLQGKTVKMVNSTAVGGGVAEMLNRMVPLLTEVGVRTRWEVITGGNDFFEVTKAFHNALQGDGYSLTSNAQKIFLLYGEQNRQRMKFDENLVVIHDPQPLGLIPSKPQNGQHWIWRCHIDLSNPNPEVWGFLRPMVERFDAAIFSSPAFARRLAIP